MTFRQVAAELVEVLNDRRRDMKRILILALALTISSSAVAETETVNSKYFVFIGENALSLESSESLTIIEEVGYRLMRIEEYVGCPLCYPQLNGRLR